MLVFSASLSSAQEYLESDIGMFGITFPGEYTLTDQVVDTEIGAITMYTYMHEAEDAAYMVAFSDYGEGTISEDNVQNSLDGAVEGFIGNLGLEISYQLEIRVDGNAGYYFKADDGSTYAMMFTIIRGSTLYQLGVLQYDYYPDMEFLESFYFTY